MPLGETRPINAAAADFLTFHMIGRKGHPGTGPERPQAHSESLTARGRLDLHNSASYEKIGNIERAERVKPGGAVISIKCLPAPPIAGITYTVVHTPYPVRYGDGRTSDF